MRPYIFKLMDAAQDEAARFSAWVKARGLAADDWITLSGRDSNGDKHGGARVLLDDSGAIVYGLGGGHEGKKLSEAFSEMRKKQDVRGQGSLFNFRADKRRDKKEDGGKLEREREALKERGKEIENRRKEQAKKIAEAGKSRFTQAKKEEAPKKPEKTLANLRGEKRANAVAAYINEQGHNIDQFRSGSFKGYPQYYFPGAGAGGQKQAFIRAAGIEIAAKCDIQDNGGLGVVVIPKAIDRLKADRYVVSNKKPRINIVTTGEEADIPLF